MTNETYCREHSGLCRKVEGIVREVELRFVALEKSIISTKGDLDIRLEAMNEFRAQLDRQANTFVPRSEIDLARTALEKKVDLLLDRSAEGKGSAQWINHIITVLIGLAVILVVWVIKQ